MRCLAMPLPSELADFLPLLQLAAASVLFLAAVLSYGVGFNSDKSFVGVAIPYPSDLLVSQPERGIFAFGLSVGACLLMAIVLLRYIQVQTCVMAKCKKLNFWSFLAAIGMVFGQASVSAFSVEELAYAHFPIACLYFAGCCFYMATQTHITRVITELHPRCLFKLRAALTILGALCPCAYAFGRLLASEAKHRYYIPQLAEWTLALIILVFMATYAVDFRNIRFQVTLVEVRSRIPTQRSARVEDASHSKLNVKNSDTGRMVDQQSEFAGVA